MTTNPKIQKTSARFMRDDDKLAIARVNQAVPGTEQAAHVDRALAARITAIRRNIGIAAEKQELDATAPAI